MVLRISLFGLILILVVVLVFTSREGFTDPSTANGPTANQVTITRMCRDGLYVNIYGYSSLATSQQVNLVYSSITPTIPNGNVSDMTLSASAVVNPQPKTKTDPDRLIINVPVSSMAEGKTYYVIAHTTTQYTAGVTPLLGSFVYSAASLVACPAAALTAPTASTKPSPMDRVAAGPGLGKGANGAPTDLSVRATPRDEVSLSDSSYDAMTMKQRSDLLRDIKTTLHNEILSSRSFDSPLGAASVSAGASHATEQGREFAGKKRERAGDDSCSDPSNADEADMRCPKNPDGSCPPMPDMSQYIRKDAIPCWGCAIDF